MAKKEQLQVPRGCVDIYGDDITVWQHIESIVKTTCNNFNVREIRTPVFEHTEVFKRDDNDSSDLVNKEMYTFYDKGLRSLTLKPEGTAGVVRAYCENNMSQNGLPQKLYYWTSCFRYERPEAGRQRQFHQFGVEFFGAETVSGEAEVIALAHLIFERLGLNDITLNINSLGDVECRKNYNETLKNFLDENSSKLCQTCQERIDKNPLRVLDCKSESCQEVLVDAPKILDTLGESCKAEFELLLKKLDNLGIPYVVNKSLVRGLDYYTKTVFEFVSNNESSGGTICGGGRYDKLVEQMGGPATKCVGFGLGIERLVILYKSLEENVTNAQPILYLGSIGAKGQALAEEIAFKLRCHGIDAECNINGKSVKAQMKYADKINVEKSVIIGDDEVECGVLPIRHMENGEVINIKYDENFMVEFFDKILNW